MAYVCGKASGFTTTFTLYAVNIDGTYEIYPLGTAPFTIAQLHADSYMPIAAGDFDGDGYDELAVYCFGDSTAAAQWGSSDNTGKPVYQTDVDGNAIDKQNRRIDADGYLIAVLNDSLTWRRIAMLFLQCERYKGFRHDLPSLRDRNGEKRHGYAHGSRGLRAHEPLHRRALYRHGRAEQQRRRGGQL